MIFTPPITPFSVTQSFGANPAKYRPNGHTGIDVKTIYPDTPDGKRPIFCSAPGKVLKASYTSIFGHYIIVDHGQGFTTYYGHCSNFLVKIGQSVALSQQIAISGTTGDVTGPHCHFQININTKPVNPLPYLTIMPSYVLLPDGKQYFLDEVRKIAIYITYKRLQALQKRPGGFAEQPIKLQNLRLPLSYIKI